MATDDGLEPSRAVVIQVLVGALADTSPTVREAATTALQENAKESAVTTLDFCITSLRGSKRRSGHLGTYHAGVLNVMAHTVNVIADQELDHNSTQKMIKLALSEMMISKDLNSEWQHAASNLLVALGSRSPDLVMEEIYLQLASSSGPVLPVVQTLADFASANACQFVPHVKGVLSRVLPVLGGVKDAHKKTFADAFSSWCEAISDYMEECPTASLLGPDMQALLHSAFELFLGKWIFSREPEVRLATAEALGRIVPLISRLQLKLALPRIFSAILALYKKENQNPYSITNCLHLLLDTMLLQEGLAPLVDFQTLMPLLNAILPMAAIYVRKGWDLEVNCLLKLVWHLWNLQNYNELLRCFIVSGMAFPEELFSYLLHRIGSKELPVRLGTLLTLKHLVSRLYNVWASRKSNLVEAVKSALQEQDLNLRKAVAELVLAMAASGYIEGANGEEYMEFLVRQCAITDREVEAFQAEEKALEKAMGTQPREPFKNDLKLGVVSPSELRAVCDKSLYLLAGTIPAMEPVLWPFLLKILIPPRYTEAVATVCKCICEVLKRKISSGESVSVDSETDSSIPQPEEILARLLVLLQNPFARNQLATRILMALYYLAPLFPTPVKLLWEDEIPKLRAYVSGPDDLRGDSWQQATWEDMILHLLLESLDVIQSLEWTMSLGNAFTSQYDLYTGDNQHTALLHRCLGMVLQKADSKIYVNQKIAVMYKRASIADEINRLGLAMGMGLVAASHLDTVLEKLKKVLESEGQRSFRRLFAIFWDQRNKPDVDDVYAALALMYGYAASYAPSTAIEARIDTLVGTNMLSRLLDVKRAAAKQAVITAINLLGQAVIKAAAHGAPFPLKRRDLMLDYTMALMVGQGSGYLVDSASTLDIEQLHTQELAIIACTTLVSVEPKLTSATRDRVLQATLGFFTLSTEPAVIVNSLLCNLTILLCAILQTSGEDGRSRLDQLQHLLKSLDQYVCSPVDYSRERACASVLALLRDFRAYCSSAPPLLPLRDSLKLGERVVAYLPRCADLAPLIRKSSAQIYDLLFSIALLLPKPVGATAVENRQASYGALSSLEELIAVTKWESVIEYRDTLQHVVESLGTLLTHEELVAALRSSTSAICDKITQCGKGATSAIKQMILKRGKELQEVDIPRITQSLFVAATSIVNSSRRQEVLDVVCCLAEQTHARLVFDELLTTALKDAQAQRKDWTKQKPSWPIQEAFLAFSQNEVLKLPFLDHLVSVLNQTPKYNDNVNKPEHTDTLLRSPIFSPSQLVATRALGYILRGGGLIVRRALEQRYPEIICALMLQLGGAHDNVGIEMLPLRDVMSTFQSFCECTGDSEMAKVLAAENEDVFSKERWTEAITELAKCAATARPKEVASICYTLWPALKQPHEFHRAAAAAALSEYVQYCGEGDKLLSQLVGVLSAHVRDEYHAVRRLCLKGLIQVPGKNMSNYAAQVLSVVVALIEDPEEEVALTAVQGLPAVLEMVLEDTVAPLLLNICVRLRSLQCRRNNSMRAAAFAALGTLSKFGIGQQQEAFLEQVHTILPSLVFHMNDEALEVRKACKRTFRKIAPLLHAEKLRALVKLGSFDSDDRLSYDSFLKDLTKHLVQHFSDRIDTYITSAIQAFDSPWSTIQANAIYFSGCLLSQLQDKRPLAVYLSQVINSLVRFTSSSPSYIVRAKSASALSFLLGDIQPCDM
ncbi:hypothetical protein O6H91_16G095300 [Diphasiastrum complanatum]|uniref:Uncharacterized protein n=1 Tax=Diphasiastrum complanatum TaxID=34168 RepID=A0ACC2BFV1_DIPCM|nr:hypothetical protein O6H91_16G095300 [Diphasiastrum complanatum]